jgi:hypothetical protein
MDGYNAITFPILGPTEGSFTSELQTSIFSIFRHFVKYYSSIFCPVTTKMTGSTSTVSVPLSAFKTANLDTIASIVFHLPKTGS